MLKAPADIPVDEQPEVRELQERLTAAQAELKAARDEWVDLNRIIDPLPSSSDTSSPWDKVKTFRARQQVQNAEMRHLEAQAVMLELTPQYDRVRSQAVRDLTTSRTKDRLPLLRKFVDALEEARDIADKILAFDQETVRLGGVSPIHPFGLLLDEPYRQGFATMVRHHVEQLEAQ